MRKHKYISYLNILSHILLITIGSIHLILLVIALIVNANKEFIIWFAIVPIILLLNHFVILIFNYFFSKYGKSKLIISKIGITYKNNIISTNCIRVVYTKFNICNIIDGFFPELIAIINHKEIKLGCFTNNEIRKMNKFLDGIIVSD